MSKTIERHQEIMGKAAIKMFNKSANFANCLAACRIAISLLAGMADPEAMVRAIADDLTSLRGILVEAPAGQHPASMDILAEPEAMPAEPKDSIKAHRDGEKTSHHPDTALAISLVTLGIAEQVSAMNATIMNGRNPSLVS